MALGKKDVLIGGNVILAIEKPFILTDCPMTQQS